MEHCEQMANLSLSSLSNEKLTSHKQLNSRVLSRLALQSMETLEFIIYPDGRVQEKVTGIIGASCAEVTAAIEAQLGRVVSQQPTSEFFANKATLESGVENTQTAFSEW